MRRSGPPYSMRSAAPAVPAIPSRRPRVVARKRKKNAFATKLGALTDSVPREGEGDKLLVNADKNPNSNGARLAGIAFTEMGINLPKIADGIRAGRIKTLIAFGEDVTKCGIGADVLARL